MKLIIEKHRKRALVDPAIYAYIVGEEHFKNTEKDRKKLKKISKNELHEECDLRFLPDDSYMVFELHPLYDFQKDEMD